MAVLFQVPELLKTILEHLLCSDYAHSLIIRSDSRKDLYHASLVNRAFRYPASELLWKHLESFRPFTKIIDGKGVKKPGLATIIPKLSGRVQTIYIRSRKSDKSDIEVYLRLCVIFESKPIFPNLRKVKWDYDDYAGPPHLLGLAAPTLTLINISTNIPSKGGRRKVDSTSSMVESVAERCPLLQDIHIRDRIQGSVISLESLKTLKCLRRVKIDPGTFEIDDALIQFLMGSSTMAYLNMQALDHSWAMEITGGDSMIASDTMKLRTPLEKVKDLVKRLPGVQSVVSLFFETQGSEHLPESLWEKRWTDIGAEVKKRFADSVQELELKDQGPSTARLAVLVDAFRALHNVTKFTYGEWYRGGISMTLVDLERMGAIWPNLTYLSLYGCDVSKIQRPACRNVTDVPSLYGLDILPLLARPFPMLRVLKTHVTSALTLPPHEEGDVMLAVSNLEELTLCDRGGSKREFWNLAASWSAVYFMISTFPTLQKIYLDNDYLNRYHQGIDFARRLRPRSDLSQQSLQLQDLEAGMLVIIEDEIDGKILHLTIDETTLLEIVDQAPDSGMVLTRSIKSGSCVWVSCEQIRASINDLEIVELAAKWNEAFSKAQQERTLKEWADRIEQTLFTTSSKRNPQIPNLTEIDQIFQRLERAQFTWKDHLASEMRGTMERLCHAKLSSTMLSKQYKWKVRAKRLKDQWAYSINLQ